MLELKSIQSGYGETQVLYGLSLEAKAGRVLAILGRNGAGKSTTLKTIMGLLPLKSGEIVYEGKPIAVELPVKVTCKIAEADPVVKGQTAASSYKPAILDNGVRVLVPPFIESGEMIVVNTADNSYVERAK